MAELETQFSFEEVAKRYGVPPDALTRLAQAGVIEVEHNGKNGREEQAVSVLTVAAAASILKQEIKPQQSAHLRGRKIRASRAAAKYDVPPPNVSRWIKVDYIRVLGSGFQRTETDQADIACISAAFKRAIEITESPIRAGWTLRRLMQTG